MERHLNLLYRAANLVRPNPRSIPTWIQKIIDRLPLRGASSSFRLRWDAGVSRVAADSNGNMHGLGITHRIRSDDGQPSPTKPAKCFRTKLSPDAVPVDRSNLWSAAGEFGDKTSLVSKLRQSRAWVLTTRRGSVTGLLRKFAPASGIQSRLWRREMGQYRGERIAERPIPGRAGVLGVTDKGTRKIFFDRVDYQITQKDTGT